MSFVKNYGFALAAALIALSGQAATAATITALDIAGPSDQTMVLSSGSYNGVATTFTLTDSLFDASFNFDVLCAATECSGRVYLMDADATTGSPSIFDTLGTSSYSVGFSTSGTSITGFSGIDLLAGTYSVMMTEIAGTAFWIGSSAPVVSGAGAEEGGSIQYEAPTVFVPEFTSYSYFSTPVLQYQLTGDDGRTDPSPVPLPASGFLLLGALGALLLRRR